MHTGNTMQSTFIESEIRDAERALVNALESSNATDWVFHYTEDAIFVGPGAPAVQGREALLQMANAMQPLSSVSLVVQRTQGSGNLAYTYGEGTWVSSRPPNTGATTRVRFVIVWRKETDGQWRVTQEMLNAMPAAK
jgi:uncharacterized protein (TIGR02246 family)